MQGIKDGDEAALRAAKIEAEAARVDYAVFKKKAKPGKEKTTEGAGAGKRRGEEEEMNMMMSNKQRELYEKMKYSERKKETDVRLVFAISGPYDFPFF